MNASIAPNAKIPIRKSMSPGTTSAVEAVAAIAIRTNGDECRGCSLPSALGIWRLVASENASRERPSIAQFAAVASVAAATIATT